MFDVLPRFKILENQYNFNDIDYFLFPDTRRFQKETLDLLNIPKSKILSSKISDIEAKQIITVDHPYVLKNNPTAEIQNIPSWILNYLNEKFIPKYKK